MKKVVSIVGVALAVLIFVGGAIFLKNRNEEDDVVMNNGSSSSGGEWSAPGDIEDPSDDKTVYTISYVMLEGDTEAQEVHTFLWYDAGTYPTSYVEGEGLFVSDLRGRVTRTAFDVPEDSWFYGAGTETGWVVDPNDSCKEYEFKGWFLDAACAYPYEYGKVYEGDLTLYADIGVARWTLPY